MPSHASERFGPPSQPTRWNEANPLASRLVSLFYFAQGQWQEAGPYGGNVQCSRIGVTGTDYKPRAQRIGPADGIMYGTIGNAVNDGYRFIYPDAITNTTEPLTIFSMAYCGTAVATFHGVAVYSDSGSVNMLARTEFGDNGIPTQDLGAVFLHAGGLNSTARNNITYSTNVPSFVSCSKDPQTAVAPRGFADGAVMGTTTNQNAAWLAPITDVWIGRRPNGVATAALNGGVAIFGLFHRMLDDSEHQALYDNPWQLLRPTRGARIFDFAAAASGAGRTRRYYDQLIGSAA